LNKIKKLKIVDLTPSLQQKLDESFQRRKPEILKRLKKLKMEMKNKSVNSLKPMHHKNSSGKSEKPR